MQNPCLLAEKIQRQGQKQRSNETNPERVRERRKRRDLLFALAEGFVEDIRVLLDLSDSDHSFRVLLGSLYLQFFVFSSILGLFAIRGKIWRLWVRIRKEKKIGTPQNVWFDTLFLPGLNRRSFLCYTFFFLFLLLFQLLYFM